MEKAGNPNYNGVRYTKSSGMEGSAWIRSSGMNALAPSRACSPTRPTASTRWGNSARCSTPPNPPSARISTWCPRLSGALTLANWTPWPAPPAERAFAPSSAASAPRARSRSWPSASGSRAGCCRAASYIHRTSPANRIPRRRSAKFWPRSTTTASPTSCSPWRPRASPSP